MTTKQLTAEIWRDAVIADPEMFLEMLPAMIKGIFQGCGHLSQNGKARLALDITNELCLTSRVNNWQYGADAVAECRDNE